MANKETRRIAPKSTPPTFGPCQKEFQSEAMLLSIAISHPVARARDEARIPLRSASSFAKATEDKLIRAIGFMESKIFLHGEFNLFKEHLLECADVVLFVKEQKCRAVVVRLDSAEREGAKRA